MEEVRLGELLWACAGPMVLGDWFGTRESVLRRVSQRSNCLGPGGQDNIHPIHIVDPESMNGEPSQLFLDNM